MFYFAIILAIFILSFILISRNFRYSFFVLLVLSVLLHKELFSFYRWDLMPVRIFMGALVVAVLWGVLRDYLFRRRYQAFLASLKDPVLISLAILWLVRLVSMFFTKNLTASLSLFVFFTTILFLAYYLICALKDDPERLLTYLRLYAYIIFGLTLFGYLQLFLYAHYNLTLGAFWPVPGNIPRVGSLFWDVNHYGAFLAGILPFVGVLLVLATKIKQRLFYLVMALSMLGALFLTNSRTAWIMAFISLVTFATTLAIKKLGLKGIGVVLALVLLVSAPFGVLYNIKDNPFRTLVKQYFHYRLDSFDSHFLLLTGSYQVFEQHPIIGGGYGSFFEHFSETPIAPTFFGKDTAALNTRVPAHTIWGELLAETGMLGLASFILLFGSILFIAVFVVMRSTVPKDYLLGIAMLSSIVGWLSAGIFYSYNAEFFWLTILLFYCYFFGLLLKLGYVPGQVFKHYLSSSKLIFGILALIAGFLIFINLGQNHLIPWDEAIYAKIAKNMVVSGDFLVERWHAPKVWYEKPPLYMWLMAGCMKILGFSETASRLPSALLGFSTVLITFLLGKKLFGKTAGFIAGLALVTSVQFLYYARTSMLDVSATFFITLALYLYYISKERKYLTYSLLSGISLGLAVMIKGVVGFIPFPIIFLYEVYLFLSHQQKFTKKLFISYLALFFSSILVYAPWHLAMSQEFGFAFWKNYIGYHVIDRATSSIEDKGRPFWWYFEVLKVSMRLWFIALLVALPIALFYAKKKYNSLVFVSIWAIFIFIFFSAATSKLVWYITPIYPAVCLIIGFGVTYLLHKIYMRLAPNKIFLFKFVSVYLLTLGVLLYFFVNRGMVYYSDATGSPARLLQLKDAMFGTNTKVYIDRLELPVALYYTDSPFQIIDFNSKYPERVPNVSYDQRLILLTKNGRYAMQVPGYSYASTLVSVDGDWTLWYLEAGFTVDTQQVRTLTARKLFLESLVAGKVPEVKVTLDEVKKYKLEEVGIQLELQQLQDKIKAKVK